MTTSILNSKIAKVEDKISDVSGLINKSTCNAKISDTEAKYFTTSAFNKFASKILETKVKEK